MKQTSKPYTEKVFSGAYSAENSTMSPTATDTSLVMSGLELDKQARTSDGTTVLVRTSSIKLVNEIDDMTEVTQ